MGGNVGRLQIEEQPRQAGDRPHGERQLLAVPELVVLDIHRAAGAVVDGQPRVPEAFDEGRGFAVAVVGGDGEDNTAVRGGERFGVGAVRVEVEPEEKYRQCGEKQEEYASFLLFHVPRSFLRGRFYAIIRESARRHKGDLQGGAGAFTPWGHE